MRLGDALFLLFDEHLFDSCLSSTHAQVIAYDKKHLLPDSRLGEARAPLDQLPRDTPAKLNLIDHKTVGNMAGDVEFTLSGCGAGGQGAGHDCESTLLATYASS